MSRADLLVSLVKAGSEGDQKLLRSTVEAMAAEERAKQHHQLADRLVKNLGSQPSGRSYEVAKAHDGGHGGLLFEVEPRRRLSDMVISHQIRQACSELVEEQHRADLLRSYGLEPRNRVLLSGAPGNGKTSLAESVATELMVPLFVVRYEAVIGSFLGETSSRLKKLFDFARTHQCVLFFDEFDTLGKERGDIHETGEIKRVVSSLLLQIDALPSHVVVITATNHPELLDRAVWRRFQLRLELHGPTTADKEKWLEQLETTLGESIGVSAKTLASKLPSTSFSDLEQFCDDVRRRYVLGQPVKNLRSIVSERLEQWRCRLKVSAPQP
jgi:predicted AAA+ superfamily ATPase